MHLSLKGFLRTPETHHEAHQSTTSAVQQTAENNLSSPPGKIHHPCPSYLVPMSKMARFTLFGMTKEYLLIVVPMTGYFLGKWLDDMETERMTRFRDKSSLFYRELAPGEKPSWP
ncbi:hypothetical protein J6590_034483 [Homalodisca vitripennis]|nr:hypothetical protein J6590_034483 [Homalodisca vitripennis]